MPVSLQALLSRVTGSLQVGLEIGDRTLRVAWRAARGGTAQWRYLHTLRTGADAETLVADLTRLLRPLRSSRFSARVLLASPTSSVQSCRLDVADPKALKEALRDQLPNLLPFALDEAQVQYHVRRQQRTGDQWTCDVTVAACEAGTLQEQLDALWRAGWAPTAVVPSAVALLAAAKAGQALSAEPTALVDLGTRRTTIVLVADGDVAYARDVTLGGEHLLEALMSQVSVGERTVNLSRADAEAVQARLGFPMETAAPPPGSEGPAAPSQPALPLATYQAMLQPLLEQLAGEVRRTMTFGAQTVQAPTPSRILLSGPGSRWPNADAWFTKHLQIPTSRMDCGPLLGEEGASAAVVCGLGAAPAAGRLDLQPTAARRRARFVRGSVGCWKAGLVALLLVGLGVGWWQARHRMVQHELRELEVRLKEFAPAQAALATTTAYLGHIERLTEQRGVRLAWFRRLAEDFPAPVRLRQLSVAPTGEVRMTGQAQERGQSPEAAVSTLSIWLEEQEICRRVQLGSSRKAEADGSLVEFTMNCRWR